MQEKVIYIIKDKKNSSAIEVEDFHKLEELRHDSTKINKDNSITIGYKIYAKSPDGDQITLTTDELSDLLGVSDEYILWSETSQTATPGSVVQRYEQGTIDTAFAQFPENAVPLQQLNIELEKKEDRVSVIEIDTNTTLSSAHNGKILLIKADVVVTFPAGLGAGFTGCAFRIATGGKMTPAFGSGVTGNDFFADYNPGESLYVFKESDSTNVFYAV